MAVHASQRDAWTWVPIAAAGCALAVASFLPAFELAIGAYTTSSTQGQRSYRYASEVGFALDLRPAGLVPLGAGLLVVAAGIVALCFRRARAWLAVGMLVLSVGLGWLVLDTSDRIRWSESGVIGYDEPHGGPLLQPALDDLETAARRSPEARDPSWTLLGGDHAYASRGELGWTALGWSTAALFWLAGYRVARLRLGRFAAVGAVAAVTVVLLVWFFFRALSRLE